MDCQKPVIDDARKRKVIKRVHTNIVYLLVVFVETLCPEIEKAGHLSAFVVPSQKNHTFWKIDFERVEEDYNLNREATPVNKVSQKQVLSVFGVSSDLQDFYKVIILSMNIAHHSQRVFNIEQIPFTLYKLGPPINTEDLVNTLN